MRRIADAVAALRAKLGRRPFARAPAHPKVTALTAAPADHWHPTAAVMRRLGVVGMTFVATVASAFLSLGVAWLFGFLIDVPDYRLHMQLAFVIPFFVTPLFSSLIALSMRDLQRAKARSRDLAALAELERTYLHSAVNNMPIGLVMFDAGKRLIVCNDEYRTMYGLPRGITERGTHLRQMLEHRLASGNFEGDREAYIERILELVEQKETSVRIVDLGDGRIISIIHHPVETGGWVGTHEDVTERQRLAAKLEEQNKLLTVKEGQLQTQNLLLDAALSNMVQGLAMFDEDQRLMLCNQRYRDMYGLSAEQTEPGTPLKELVEPGTLGGVRPDRPTSQAGASPVAELMLHLQGQAESAQFCHQLGDGRSISIAAQPMPGGGTVTTHQDITEQRRSEAKIAHMALHDSLTGLANRVLINERLAQALARARRGELVAVHFLDLDRFKGVNDTLGHAVGDQLLRLVTERLLLAARDTDTVARMGGDEFAIVQVGIAKPADATQLARRTVEEVSKPYSIDGHHIIIGTSVGIAVGPGDGDAPDQLLRSADLALYRAKSDGRGTYRFFEPAMDAQMQHRRAMENDLRSALLHREFELYYQPIMALESNDVSGFEALLRWHHPDNGLQLPGSFIPLAEEIGLIVPLGEWIIRQACTAAASWPDDLHVAVNLSPVQFRSPGLVQIVVGALAAAGLAPARLELEITEGALLQNNEQTLSILHQLRDLGVRIALDDFGTGFSSLGYLQSFPFDKIKIDRSFVGDVSPGSGSRNIVRAVATMAAGLGMTATAEGVETLEQLEAVRSEGCGEVQGFYFSKPIPAIELDRQYLARRRAAKRTGSGSAA